MKVVQLRPGAKAPAHSDLVAVTRVNDREFQADGIVASGRLRPIVYDPGTNFPTAEHALHAALRWASRNGAEIVFVRPISS